MSSISELQVMCPNCHVPFSFQTWDSVNVTLQPYMKDKVLYGDIFRAECPHCHQVEMVEYPIIYHDMEKQIMVTYNRACEQSEFRVIASLMHAELPDTYHIRLVATAPDFIEKITILDEGYDDRLMEMLKIFLMGELISDGLPEEMELRFCQNDADGLYFLVLLPGDMVGNIPFSPDMYQVLENVFRESLLTNTDTYINMEWAHNFILEHQDIV